MNVFTLGQPQELDKETNTRNIVSVIHVITTSRLDRHRTTSPGIEKIAT